eukprot:3596117-Amphidinium_carterae.1
MHVSATTRSRTRALCSAVNGIAGARKRIVFERGMFEHGRPYHTQRRGFAAPGCSPHRVCIWEQHQRGVVPSAIPAVVRSRVFNPGYARTIAHPNKHAQQSAMSVEWLLTLVVSHR